MTLRAIALPQCVWPRIASALALGWIVSFLCLPSAICNTCGSAIGQSLDTQIATNIKMLQTGSVGERTGAAKLLIGNWEKSLPLLVKELAALESSAPNPGRTDETYLVAITDVVRTVIANNNSATDLFRKSDDISGINGSKVVQTLAWSARGDNKDLRINATYILANVVDNSNVCVVLDHLRDPKLPENGRVNLLQVVVPVASYAYKDTMDQINKTMDVVEKKDPKNARIGEIKQRLEKSSNSEVATREKGIPTFCPNPGLAPLS